MILPPWSFSHLNTWLTCPHQYAHKYVLRDLPSEPQSEAMKWGNTVHEAFEARLSGWETYDREMFKPYERYAKAIPKYGVAASSTWSWSTPTTPWPS